MSLEGQRALGRVETGRGEGRAYIVFLASIAAVPPLATDMYLAAMPIIARQRGVADSRVALSLVLWFIGFSGFLLVYGPLSDKYGRRPILLAGLGLFTAATAACSLAANVTQLVVFRVLQGIGAAGPPRPDARGRLARGLARPARRLPAVTGGR